MLTFLSDVFISNYSIIKIKKKSLNILYVYIRICMCAYVKQIKYNYNKQNILMRSILHL
jgi:hypothetical protein